MNSLDRARLLLGGLVILAIVFLGAAIALGDVKEATSYGLNYIMTILGTFSLSFGQWAYPSVIRHETKPPGETASTTTTQEGAGEPSAPPQTPAPPAQGTPIAR